MKNKIFEMFRCCFWCLMAVLVVTQIIEASMSNSKAAAAAFKIWGIASYTGTDHPWFKTSETKKIGFLSPGCQSDITIVGQGDNTWDAAFASLPPDKGIGGTYSGMQWIHTAAPPEANEIGAVHTLIPGGLNASAVQFLLDGKPVGGQVPLIHNSDMTGWQADLPWDSRTVADGFHVLCGVLFHPDGAEAKTQAMMIVVKQVP